MSDRLRMRSLAAGLALVGLLGTDLAAGGPRTLRFPADRPVGVISVRPVGVNGWSTPQIYRGWHYFSPARGEVIVPEGQEIKYEVAATAFKDLSFLSSLGPDAIEWLAAERSSAVDVPALRTIAQLRGLRGLDLVQCEIADASLGELGRLPRLEAVHLSYPDEPRQPTGPSRERHRPPQSPPLVRGIEWLASLPELKDLQIDGWQLRESTIDALPRCRNLESLSFNIPQLKEEHVRSLARLSRLRSLRIYAESQDTVGPSFAAFRTSKSLESLTLSGMRLDAARLRGLSEISSLRKLDFSVANFADDAVPALKSLKQIEELRFPVQMPHGIRSQLVEVLVKLPNIRVWPTVGVDEKALDRIAGAVWIESLGLTYSQHREPPSEKQFSSLRRLTNLRNLTIDQLPFGDQDLKELAQLKSLTSLMLRNTEVTGEGFHFLKDLPILNHVDIMYMPAGVQPHLASLAELRHVNRLMVGIPELSVDDFAWLGRMPQLTHLRIIQGLIDDRKVAHLAGLKNLEDLSLEHALLSDDGLRPLLGLKKLTHLRVGGFLSDKGILQLAALPRLEWLDVGSKDVTDAGLRELQKKSSSPLLRVNRTRMMPAGRELVIDKHGFWRTGDAVTRSQLDPLEGHPAPSLSVHDWQGTEGRPLSLSDLRGKVVLIDFWGVWCGACIAEMPALQRIRDKYRDQGFVMIGMHTTQDGEQLAQFAREQKLSWPNAVDISKQTFAAYHTYGCPTHYLVDRQGILRIANPHPYQLEEQIQRLLAEPISRMPN